VRLSPILGLVDVSGSALARCVQTNTRSHSPGRLEAEFDVRYALIGAWFESPDEIMFDRLDF
jgi:hypothetical protein